MSKQSREKLKGRRTGGTFTRLPHAVQDSENYSNCGKSARALLADLIRHFNGKNNGDLCAAVTTLRPYGWTRGETISHLLRELRHYGLIKLTRQGGLNTPSLYALTWEPINECKGKLDCKPTITAPGDWKEPVEKYQKPKRKPKLKRQAEKRHGLCRKAAL